MIKRKSAGGDIHKRPAMVVKHAAEDKKKRDKKFHIV